MKLNDLWTPLQLYHFVFWSLFITKAVESSLIYLVRNWMIYQHFYKYIIWYFWSLLVCGFKMTCTICEYVKGVKKKTMQKIQRIKTPLAAASYRFLTPKMKRLNRLTSYLSEHVSKRRFTDVKEPDHSINCEVFSPLKFPSGTRILFRPVYNVSNLKIFLRKGFRKFQDRNIVIDIKTLFYPCGRIYGKTSVSNCHFKLLKRGRYWEVNKYGLSIGWN